MSARLLAFLRLFLPLAVLFSGAAWLVVSTEHETEVERLKTRELLHVGRGATIVDRNLLANFRDLKLLAGDQQLWDFIAQPSDAAQAALARHLTNFLLAKPVYDQVRFIDRDGQERLRINLVDGQALMVPADRLQNKSDRYYFTDTMKLAAGEIFLSPLDLNSERGQVERPFKPMLRFATPILGPKGDKAGIVILNYLGGDLINQFRRGVGDGADHVSLVNSDGYWLSASNAQDEWGFMLNRPELSMAVRHPLVWPQISGKARGQFIDASGLWSFVAVDPLTVLAPLDNLRLGPRELVGGESRYNWYVVSHVPAAELEVASDYSPARVGSAVIALLLFIALGIVRFQQLAAREAQNNSRFKAYFDHAMVGMATTSLDKRLLAVNAALCRLLGYSEHELMQKTWSEVTFPEDLAADVANFECILRGETEGYSMEKRFLRKDGQVIDANISVECVRKPDRSIDFFVAIVEDITERKRATRALAEQQDLLRSLSDNLPESYLYQLSIDAQGQPVFCYISSGVTRLHGISQQAVLDSAEALFQLAHVDDLPKLQAATVASAEHLTHFSLIIRVRLANACWGWMQLRSFPHRTALGEIVWDGVATNVTEQHENELIVQHISQRAEILLELPQKVEELDDRALMQYAMEQAEMLTGSQIAFIHLVNDDQETIELVTWSSSTLAHYCTAVFDRHYPISQAGIWAEAARQQKAVVYNDYATAENKRGLPQGHSALTRLMSVPVIEDGKVRLMAGVGNKPDDYTQLDIDSVQLIANYIWRLISKRKSDLALQVASRVVNASSVVCFRWRAEPGWPVDFVSENVRQWGYEPEALRDGKPSFAEMVHPDDLAWVAQEVTDHTAAGRSPYHQEYRIVTQAGQIRWVADETIVLRKPNGEVEFYDGVLSDITGRKLAEQGQSQSLVEQRALNKKLEQANNQLLQSEKMASIGQLAAGIAHELNNPIGFVHSNLGTLEGYLRDLMFIIESYDRALDDGASPENREIARIRMDEIRKERDFDFVHEDIFQLVSESRDGLDRVRRIVLDLKTFSRVGSQDWEYANLNQGLESTLNIVWNELKYKCTVNRDFGDLPLVYCLLSQINQVFLNLLVNAGQAIDEKGEITLRTARRGEDEVVIEVSDTGKGIPPENISRIFDPFFTTKPVGKGTGLGLSLSYSIIEAHHGRIEVESQVGVGTTFRVVLPIAKSD